MKSVFVPLLSQVSITAAKMSFKGWRLAQLLKAPTGWAEGLILFHITQARQLTIACHSSPKGI